MSKAIGASSSRLFARCDRCAGELYQREDDREETVRARFEIYARDTAPVLRYYQDAGLLHEISGVGSREEMPASRYHANRIGSRFGSGGSEGIIQSSDGASEGACSDHRSW